MSENEAKALQLIDCIKEVVDLALINPEVEEPLDHPTALILINNFIVSFEVREVTE